MVRRCENKKKGELLVANRAENIGLMGTIAKDHHIGFQQGQKVEKMRFST